MSGQLCADSAPCTSFNEIRPCQLATAMAAASQDEIMNAVRGMCPEHQECFMRHLNHALALAKLELNVRHLREAVIELLHV